MAHTLLIVHNAYIHSGGEDTVVAQETDALRAAGWPVETWIVRTTPGLSTAAKAALAPLGQGEQARLEKAIERLRPAIVHAHNLYPLFSPKVFREARRAGARTVLTLHNYRPLCLNGLFLTPSGEVCERCAGGNYWHGIVRGCYRSSRIQSSGIAAHLETAALRHWYDAVDCFIAPSVFLKNRFVAAGFPSEKIEVQGHFVPDVAPAVDEPPEPYLLYLGRLSEEKGVRLLLQRFASPQRSFRLVLAGQGPLAGAVEKSAGTITWAGFVEGRAKQELIRRAAALVMPSICYENFPLAIAEANGLGTPALASRSGGLGEMIKPGVNGAFFNPAEPDSLWRGLDEIEQGGKELRQRAQRHAVDYFSKDSFLARRLKLYERLLGAA